MKVKKNLTHIYHGFIWSPVVVIGSAWATRAEQTVLFEKALALTSDLKRLPFLLGGKLSFWYDSHVLVSLVASVLEGVGATIVLLNGSYEAGDFAQPHDLMSDEQAKDDILLMTHGTFHAQTSGIAIEIQDSHWDFEGQVVLYDTITLIIFIDTDTNVGTANFGDGVIRGIYEIEVDWRPFSPSELQEFIMEHIYAKQGD